MKRNTKASQAPPNVPSQSSGGRDHSTTTESNSNICWGGIPRNLNVHPQGLSEMNTRFWRFKFADVCDFSELALWTFLKTLKYSSTFYQPSSLGPRWTRQTAAKLRWLRWRSTEIPYIGGLQKRWQGRHGRDSAGGKKRKLLVFRSSTLTSDGEESEYRDHFATYKIVNLANLSIPGVQSHNSKSNAPEIAMREYRALHAFGDVCYCTVTITGQEFKNIGISTANWRPS